MQEPR